MDVINSQPTAYIISISESEFEVVIMLFFVYFKPDDEKSLLIERNFML